MNIDRYDSGADEHDDCSHVHFSSGAPRHRSSVAPDRREPSGKVSASVPRPIRFAGFASQQSPQKTDLVAGFLVSGLCGAGLTALGIAASLLLGNGALLRAENWLLAEISGYSSCLRKRLRLIARTTTAQIARPITEGSKSPSPAPRRTMPRRISMKYVTGMAKVAR